MGHILYQIAVDLVLCVLILSLTAVPALNTSQPGKQSSAGDSLSTQCSRFPACPLPRFPAFIPPPHFPLPMGNSCCVSSRPGWRIISCNKISLVPNSYPVLCLKNFCRFLYRLAQLPNRPTIWLLSRGGGGKDDFAWVRIFSPNLWC